MILIFRVPFASSRAKQRLEHCCWKPYVPNCFSFASHAEASKLYGPHFACIDKNKFCSRGRSRSRCWYPMKNFVPLACFELLWCDQNHFCSIARPCTTLENALRTRLYLDFFRSHTPFDLLYLAVRESPGRLALLGRERSFHRVIAFQRFTWLLSRVCEQKLRVC